MIQSSLILGSGYDSLQTEPLQKTLQFRPDGFPFSNWFNRWRHIIVQTSSTKQTKL